MSDGHEEGGGSFREYRQLILAHIKASNRRQDAVEDAITEMKVKMGVLVVKVGIIVAIAVTVGGAVTTYLVKTTMDSVMEQTAEDD